MSFCIGGEGNTLDVDSPDIDRAMCGECDKFLKWGDDRIADCCGYRYTYWTSTVTCHRVKIAAAQPGAGEK